MDGLQRSCAIIGLAAALLGSGLVRAQGVAPPAASVKAPPTASACRMYLIGEVKIDFNRNRVLTTGEINGRPIVVQIDTGASSTLIFRSAAARLGLTLNDLRGVRFFGVGGETRVQTALVKTLSLAGASLHNSPLLVAGERAADVDLLLGEDFLSAYDEEFDFAHHVMRLLKPQHCADDEMAYWSKGPYDETPLIDDSGRNPQLHIQVRLNGAPVDAILDSGAATSTATPAAAARAHVRLKAEDPGGRYAYGVGAHRVPEQSVMLDSFRIGDETVTHPRLMFGDLFRDARYEETGSRIAHPVEGLDEMLLGADFFQAHHILVSHARHMVYFTYNGGPVFSVDRPSPRPEPAPAPPAPVPAAAAPERAPDHAPEHTRG